MPTIFQVGESFIGYSSNKWVMLSSQIQSDGMVVLDAKSILLTSAPDLKFNFASVDKNGIGVGFSSKSGEYAIQAILYHDKESNTSENIVHNQKSSISADSSIQINANILEDYGAIYDAEMMKLNTKIEIHGVLKDVLMDSSLKEELSAGLKLGIKSNLVKIIKSAKDLTTKYYRTPEGYINAISESNRMYDEILIALSKNSNHGVSGGLWFYGGYKKDLAGNTVHIAVPTIFNTKQLISESDELNLIAAQYNVYNAYLKTKYLNARNSEHEIHGNINRVNYDIDVPISGSIPPGLSTLTTKANQYQKVVLNAKIIASENLTFHVMGKADLKGIYIQAKHLDAMFDELILESVQDIIKNQQRYQALGLNFNVEGISKANLMLKDSNRDVHVIEELSAIIGTERTNIVVANALRLNGAMIACAEKDEDTSKFTDHGNLTLKVGELFVQHIYDYDNGKTIGFALETKKILDGVTFGMKNMASTTQATVGLGSLEVEHGQVPSDLNRDLENIQKELKNINIDPIEIYFPDFAQREELRSGITLTGNFIQDIAEISKSFGKSILDELEHILPILNENIPIVSEPEYISIIEDENIVPTNKETAQSQETSDAAKQNEWAENFALFLNKDQSLTKDLEAFSQHLKANDYERMNILARVLHSLGSEIIAFEKRHPILVGIPEIISTETNKLIIEAMAIPTKNLTEVLLGKDNTKLALEEIAKFSKYVFERITDNTTPEIIKSLQYLTLIGSLKVIKSPIALIDEYLTVSKKVAPNEISNAVTRIKWSHTSEYQGIKIQGMAYEEYLATKLQEGTRLPEGFKAFDFYDESTKLATSVKTLDTLTPSKLANPKQIYNTLKEYIDQSINFANDKKLMVEVSNVDIKMKIIEVAIPRGTNIEQYKQIEKAINYAKDNGIELNITRIR